MTSDKQSKMCRTSVESKSNRNCKCRRTDRSFLLVCGTSSERRSCCSLCTGWLISCQLSGRLFRDRHTCSIVIFLFVYWLSVNPRWSRSVENAALSNREAEKRNRQREKSYGRQRRARWVDPSWKLRGPKGRRKRRWGYCGGAIAISTRTQAGSSGEVRAGSWTSVQHHAFEILQMQFSGTANLPLYHLFVFVYFLPFRCLVSELLFGQLADGPRRQNILGLGPWSPLGPWNPLGLTPLPVRSEVTVSCEQMQLWAYLQFRTDNSCHVV